MNLLLFLLVSVFVSVTMEEKLTQCPSITELPDNTPEHVVSCACSKVSADRQSNTFCVIVFDQTIKPRRCLSVDPDIQFMKHFDSSCEHIDRHKTLNIHEKRIQSSSSSSLVRPMFLPFTWRLFDPTFDAFFAPF